MTDETLNMANDLNRKIKTYDNLLKSAKKDGSICMTIFNEGVGCTCKLSDYIEPDQIQEITERIIETLRIRLEELKTQYELL